MAGGRPTKYSKTMLDKAQEYLEIYDTLGDVVPTREGMADHLDVTMATLYNWSDTYHEFFDTLQRANGKQARKLISGGLDGTFQPTIAKLMLANHGYHEKQDMQITGKDGGPVQHTVVWGKHGDG